MLDGMGALACHPGRPQMGAQRGDRRHRPPDPRADEPALSQAVLGPEGLQSGVIGPAQAPTASATHFFMWLLKAAPASFLSFESAEHLALASASHFFMWLVSAAPASFLSAESLLHVAKALLA